MGVHISIYEGEPFKSKQVPGWDWTRNPGDRELWQALAKYAPGSHAAEDCFNPSWEQWAQIIADGGAWAERWVELGCLHVVEPDRTIHVSW